jgi:GMP synthase-like glutamine amidotransferase
MSAPRLAYLDNGRTPDRVSGLPQLFSAEGLEVVTFRAFDEVFPDDPAGFDGILLSGSAHGAYDDVPFIHREHDFIRTAAQAGTPMLGLCFGSQILASALCGRDQVFRRASCEVAHATLTLSDHAAGDRLAGGLGREIGMFVWHNDEVRHDHPDMVVLASTDECPNQIWRFRDAPVWGIQGHPELTRANARDWIGKAADALRKDGADPEQLILETEDSRAGLGMLRNFARICQSTVRSTTKGE